MRAHIYKPVSKELKTAKEGGLGLTENFRIKQLIRTLVAFALGAFILILSVFLLPYFLGK